MTTLAFAETRVFIEEYTYQASEADSKFSCRVIALEQVKRLLLEKLGIYLESETEVKNFELTKDQIVTLTAGIVSAEIVDEKWDGKTYSLKAKIAADPKEVIKSIELLRQDRQKSKELVETIKKADEALREVERLKKELEIAKAGKTEKEQYNKAVNVLSATDWLLKGYSLANANKYQGAIEAFGRAIKLNPNLTEAYNSRGMTYGVFLREYRQAITDLDKAIELNPKDVRAYRFRGDAYSDLGDYQQAIRDCTRAIELDSKYAGSYYCRGNAYSELASFQQAIRDYDRGIELNPNLVEGYYNNRGYAYSKLGDYRRAIRDYDKAIELNPNIADTYSNRGIAYGKLGNSQQALEDLKTAARLGHKATRDAFRARGIEW
jgi:tetratricopeptide (TPR) repeat protein